MDLSNLKPAPGAKRDRKRVGRGSGSGLGKTSGRGHKGQKARSGAGRSIKDWMHGGQMPLHLLIPKRGFRNIFKQQYQVVNLDQLAECPAEAPVTVEVLKKLGKVKSLNIPVKLLGRGEVDKAYTIALDAVSRSAREKIEAAGGKVEVAKC